MDMGFRLWLENSHGVAKEPQLPSGPPDLPYTEEEHRHAKEKLAVYQCPRCGGDAYNGVPGCGLRYRGSAKCSKCHEGFAVVVPGVKPKHRDGPEIGYSSDDMRRQSAKLDAWLKANSPDRQDEAKRHRVPPPVKYNLPLAKLSSDMSKVNGASGWQAWEEVGDFQPTSREQTNAWMSQHAKNTTMLGGQMSDEEFHAFYGLPTPVRTGQARGRRSRRT